MKSLLVILLLCLRFSLIAQPPNVVYSSQVKTVQLYPAGDQLGFPIIRLNSGEQVELHFDDLDGNVKNYYYTYQLCNADWTPALLNTFDYVKGYSQMRLSQYRISSLALTRYTHYQAVLPDRNCTPSRSGNYLLKVFLDGDTSKLVFTRALLVVDERSSLVAAIQQPYNGQFFRSHQKVQFKVSLNQQIDVVNPNQQVKVVILQNQRWDNALTHIRPTFFSRNQIEFNTEADCLLPGGKEWRWLDLRSFRYQSDRVLRAEYNRTATDIFVKPDMDRSAQRFNFFRDNNGQYFIQCSESINPLWQGDYATVHFAFVPPNNVPLSGQDVYLFGQLSNYELNDAAKMTFNEETNVYEKSLILKQGYYDYCYVTRDQQHPENPASFQFTEGDYWEAENTYILLLYYRPLAGRADELIGYAITNSRFGR